MILVSRSARENPNPFERCVRTTSPSSTSSLDTPRSQSDCAKRVAIVVFPEQGKPVNQIVKAFIDPSSTQQPACHGDLSPGFDIMKDTERGRIAFPRHRNQTASRTVPYEGATSPCSNIASISTGIPSGLQTGWVTCTT